jgi:hypothetical protein
LKIPSREGGMVCARGVYGLSILVILAVPPQGAGRRRTKLHGPSVSSLARIQSSWQAQAYIALAAWFVQELLGARIRQAISGVAGGRFPPI